MYLILCVPMYVLRVPILSLTMLSFSIPYCELIVRQFRSLVRDPCFTVNLCTYLTDVFVHYKVLSHLSSVKIL